MSSDNKKTVHSFMNMKNASGWNWQRIIFQAAIKLKEWQVSWNQDTM
jgi:hypothetical protein